MAPTKRRYKALPLFASPLEEHLEHHQVHEYDSHEHESHSGKEPTLGEGEVTTEIHQTRLAFPRMPTFRQREEASSIELFYDLFFVANLSSFTSVHSIDDTTTLKSYIGFFSLLWFNWLQVTLYDVRFSVDSIFERVCKALHLGIMVAFAVVGTQFDTSDNAKHAVTFQQFSCIMMVSRIILLIQYGYVLFWVRSHRMIIRPLLVHMVAYAIGAIVCLGLIFSFDKEKRTNAYLAWYPITVAEAMVVFISSNRWRSVSFKRTNLSERVGLLTLIILGEGVIVLVKSMNYATRAQNYSPAVAGQIISSTLIIYFIYMLYFDQVNTKHFGTIRQQFWALGHFPFHVALILLLEGTSRFVTWCNAMEVVNHVIAGFAQTYQSSSDTAQISLRLDSYINSIADNHAELKNNIAAERYQSNISSAFDALAASVNPDSEQAMKATSEIFSLLLRSIFESFHIKTPDEDSTVNFSPDSLKDPFQDLNSILHVYDLVFVYFFVAAGCTLLMMSLLLVRQVKNKCLGDYAAIASRAVVGLGLAGVAGVKGNYTSKEHFLWSAWMLPTVLLAIAAVVLLDGVFGYFLPAPPEIQDCTLKETRGKEGGDGKVFVQKNDA